MKYCLFLLLALAAFSCNNHSAKSNSPSDASACYSGKLVKKGICGHFVIEMLSPAVSEVKMERAWTDSSSMKNYKNVFTVSNICEFPETLKENEEFLFQITASTQQDCIRCEAYTPVPVTSNVILVCKK